MPLFPAPLVVVDFETTGFQHHDWAQPIEIGAVLLDTDGSEIGSFESLIFQVIDDRAYPALEINGIKPVDIVDFGKLPGEVAMSFSQWLQGRWCTSYNIDFDSVFMTRLGVDVRWVSCVMKKAQADIGRRTSLANAAKHYGVEFTSTAHRALADARVAAGIAVAIKRKSS